MNEPVAFLSARHAKFLRKAISCAGQSEMMMQLGAVGTLGSNIVAEGFNNYRNTVRGRHFCSQHAEIAVMCNVFHQHKWREKGPQTQTLQIRHLRSSPPMRWLIGQRKALCALPLSTTIRRRKTRLLHYRGTVSTHGARF
jgi:hypothetical protein